MILPAVWLERQRKWAAKGYPWQNVFDAITIAPATGAAAAAAAAGTAMCYCPHHPSRPLPLPLSLSFEIHFKVTVAIRNLWKLAQKLRSKRIEAKCFKNS